MDTVTIRATDELRRQIVEGENDLRAKRDRLAAIERGCQHRWGKTVYDPIRYPGSPDRMPRDGSYVPYDERPYLQATPPSTRDRWRRTCEVCGRVEHTERTTDKVEKVPAF